MAEEPKQFKDLSGHLLLAMALVEQLEAGKKRIDDEDAQTFLTFEVGCALIDVFRLTGEDPTGTLIWIKEMSKQEKNNGENN